MSEVKRAILTTLEPSKSDNKKVKNQCKKTVRIHVTLPEPNENKCPEFNYKEELINVKKKIKPNDNKLTSSIPLKSLVNLYDRNSEDEDADDVRRIAKEMEAKYGRKRKHRKDDYADIGAGYDESDSFIDNTDGYDEIIPPNVTTVRGGFYINSGALEFKTDDEATSDLSSSNTSADEMDREDDGKVESDGQRNNVNVLNNANNKIHNRKRILDSTDEEECDAAASNDSSDSEIEKNSNIDKANISMQQAIKKKLFSSDKIQIKKQKLLSDDTRNKMYNDFRAADNGDKDSIKENKKPIKSVSSIDDAIESVINRSDNLKKSRLLDAAAVSCYPFVKEIDNEQKKLVHHHIEEPMDTTTTIPTNDLTDILNSHNGFFTDIVKLPENLPKEISNIIESIKQAAKDYKDIGKVKFFNGDVNNMLLNLEYKCKILGRSSRVKVYEHLAPFVRCRKETLIKRAKNLVADDEEKKLKKTIRKLKNDIDKSMPSLIETYEKECQIALITQRVPDASGGVGEQQLKCPKMPRKRYPLVEDTKRIIRDIISLKKRCFLHEGKSKDLLEDLLTDYLKNEILILWPKGWMSVMALRKYCSTSSSIKQSTTTPTTTTESTFTASEYNNSNSNKKHSQSSSVPVATQALPVAAPSPQSQPPPPPAVINFSTGNHLTITPVIKVEEKSKNNNEPIVINNSTPVIKPVQHTEMLLANCKERKDNNGVIVVNNSKVKKEDAVMLKTATTATNTLPQEQQQQHCQIIDLTDCNSPLQNVPKHQTIKEEKSEQYTNSYNSSSNNNKIDSNLVSNYQKDSNSSSYGKLKLEPDPPPPPPPLTPGGGTLREMVIPEDDIEDIQKVIASLKALHELSSSSSSPSASKKDCTTKSTSTSSTTSSSSSSSVSVIALNKNYSNSNNNYNHFSSASVDNRRQRRPSPSFHNEDRTFTGFQEEFQKQFISTFGNIKSTMSSPNHHRRTPSPPPAHHNISKSTNNYKCS